MDREYEPNPEDERIVDLSDEGDLPPPPPTVDPDERLEVSELDEESEIPPMDDERSEPL